MDLDAFLHSSHNFVSSDLKQFHGTVHGFDIDILLIALLD